MLEAIPALERALAPLPLCSLPTPAEALPALDANARIKHDDLTHPEYGGNKLRKLEFVAGIDARVIGVRVAPARVGPFAHGPRASSTR